MCRVESIASTTSLDVDFSGLRNAIQSLQKASIKLDAEKTDAEKKLKKLLRKFARRHFIRRKIRTGICKLRKLFGKPCRHQDASALSTSLALGLTADKAFECSSMRAKNGLLPFKPRIGRAPAWAQEQREWAAETQAFDKHRFPTKRFKKAVKRIREVNQKLKEFERGFIHEEGIKDREWYRNLDVAPGKWLGESGIAAYMRMSRLCFANSPSVSRVQDMALRRSLL